MPNRYWSRGFTLLELLVVLVLVAIIMTFTVPALTAIRKNSNRHAAVSELITLINLARNTAVAERTTVTLCPLDDANECVDDWSRPIWAFRDPDRDAAREPGEEAVRHLRRVSGGYLQVGSSFRDYFRFLPSGRARDAIGNIIWCPRDHDVTQAEQIRINMGGRPMLAEDSNGDGIVEGSNGQSVDCP